MRRCTFRLAAGLAAVLLTMVPVVSRAAVVPPDELVRTDTVVLLEDLESTRLLLGATCWLVHDLRNFALSGAGDLEELEDYDRYDLTLYEKLKPLDFAASSLLLGLDMGDLGTAREDIWFLRAEVNAAAAEVLEHYRAVAALHAQRRQELLERAEKDGLDVHLIRGQPWADPLRERQRQAGVQLGWRTNLEPPDGFRERFWDQLQGLDIRYQLRKGRMLGVTAITPKDPVLRWDLLEPEPGRYDFAAFDRMMDLLTGQGYRVRLIVPTLGGRVPDWWLAERPESVIRDGTGEADFTLNPGTFAHDFMGPVKRDGPWYQARAVNLADAPTRERFAACMNALGAHCRERGWLPRVLCVSADQFHAQRHWRVPPGTDLRAGILAHYRAAGEILRAAFRPVPVDLEVTEGEAHFIDGDLGAHEWRSVGLTRLLGLPGVASESPFFEDVMRAAAAECAAPAARKAGEPGPFFYQNCEYGFGTMLSVNFFTSLLRDGLWSEGWFGPEGILRWGYFPQIFAWNDRQLQWSGITNGYLAFRQAHLLGPTLANTRVTPADVLLLLPSASLDVQDSRTHRELVGWGWALTALKIPYDVLPEQALARGVPARARLLILPQALLLGAPQAKAIRAFVQGGGRLLVSGVPGSAGKAPGPLADVLGCDVLRAKGKPVAAVQTGVAGTWLQVTVPRGMHSGKLQPILPPDQGYPRQRASRAPGSEIPFLVLAPRTGALIVGKYGTGQVAIVGNGFGKGRTLALGYPFGNELVAADWTSVAFGKIYNGWARDEQMLGMLRWLDEALRGLGYVPAQAVPRGWRHRLQGFEACASSLSFPKGPERGGDTDPFLLSMTYLDSRRRHRIPQDEDRLDYAAELTWRDRPGVATRYLAVANRESAYAGERAAVQFWMMPHLFEIVLRDPGIRRIYDIGAQAPVAFERIESGVRFRTSVPPALGRVFAVSATDAVALFEGAGYPGISFDALALRVEHFADAAAAPTESQVLQPDEIRAWLVAQRGRRLQVGCGDKAYRRAAARLVEWLRERLALEAEVTLDDGRFELRNRERFEVSYQPAPARILIGNSWSSNTLAAHDCAWPYNNADAPARPSARLTATYAWPGGERGVVALTRASEYRRADGTPFGLTYGNTEGCEPRSVDDAKAPYLQRKLLVLASTPEGAEAAVQALIRACDGLK